MIESTKQNVWFNKPSIGEDEVLLFELPANCTQGRRAVGGKLFTTDQRILFITNRIDAMLGGKCKEISKESVTEIARSKPVRSVSELFSGAMRTRICIRTEEDDSYLFVVNSIDQTMELFQQHDPYSRCTVAGS